jgi:H+/Cl- antiporter ClcA/predicted transcriptional regulator
MWLLSAVGALLGLVGGGAAVGLFKLIGLITHLTLLHDVGFDLPSLRGYHPDPWLLLVVVGGALIVSIIALWSPVIRGHGIPESLEAILVRDSKIRPRAAVAKPLSAAVTIGTGGPFGAEGPIIVTGGSVGSLIGQVLSVSPVERRIMLATGATAGMSATFNTPLAAVILAIELVLFERSLRTIVPLSIASAVAAGIHIIAFGSAPLFAVATQLHVNFSHLPLYVIVGVASGVLAVVLNKGLFAMEAAFRKLPVHIFWWPCIGAVGYGIIGLFEPRTLSMGYSAIVDTLNGRFTVAALGVLFVAKLFAWWIALGSQTSGGTLAPIFLVSSIMGCLLGHGVNAVIPGLHASPAAFALVAMGATFGAASKAVFASVVFAAEVTAQYHMVIPLMVGAGVAELVVEGFLTDRLMTEKLSHRGFRVDFRTEVGALRMRIARQIMREPVTVGVDRSMAEVTRLMQTQQLPLLAVTDADGHYLGLITAQRLAEPGATRAALLRDLLDTQATPIDARDFLATALTRMISAGVDALPVVENGRVVGQLDRADIAAERHRHHTAIETRQPGWMASVRSRRRGDGTGPVVHCVGSPSHTLSSPARPSWRAGRREASGAALAPDGAGPAEG